MSDTLQRTGLRRVLLKPFFAARLRDTPLRDLVRGRVTGRLNYKLPIAVAPLPQPVRDLILRVVRHTRLWRIEKTDVADELIAHFVDGVASGATEEELIQDFGDERQAARLIRRAKIRNRSILWHARRWAFRALLAIVGLYVIGVIRFFCGSPSVKVDYLARLNAPTLAVPESDRAWPLLRQAIIATQPPSSVAGITNLDPRAVLRDGRADVRWQIATQWLDENQPTVELIQQAAQKRVLGFVYGPGGSAEDPVIGWTNWQKSAAAVSPIFASIYLPNLSEMRATAHLMSADMRRAVERGDAPRAQRDYETLLNLANLIGDTPILVCNLVAIGIDAMAFDHLELELLNRPEKFDDATLIALAHRTSRVGGETASSLINLDGEQMMFDDMIQHIYTDDGYGDGRLTPKAVQTLAVLSANAQRDVDNASTGEMMATATLSLIDSRRDNVQAHDQVLRLFERMMAKPYREGAAAVSDEAEQLTTQWNVSPITRAHYLVASIMTPALNRASATGERILAERDALTTALALELYRRHHDGQYPQSLDALVPDLLPSVPVDRINGEPLKYRIVNGKPLLYSVGSDRDDDGGRVPLDFHGQPSRYWAAIGNDAIGPEHKARDGDWVLYGQPLLDEYAQSLAEDFATEFPSDPTTAPAAEPSSNPTSQR